MLWLFKDIKFFILYSKQQDSMLFICHFGIRNNRLPEGDV